MSYAAGPFPPGPYRPTVLTPSPVASPPAVSPPVRGAQVRYRLALNGESEHPAEALRCYSGCRRAATEEIYLACLRDCPGFEATAGASCGPDDGIPRSVCLEQRPPGQKSEPDPGVIVAAVILNVALIFSLASVCSANNVRCYGGGPWYPWGY